MQITFAKKRFLKLLLNSRTICAYMMAITYLCTHYFVSFAKYEEVDSRKVEFEFEFSPAFATSSFIKSTRSTIKTPARKSPSPQAVVEPLRFDAPKLYLDAASKQLTHRYNLRNKTNRFSSQIMQDRIVIHLLNTSGLRRGDEDASASGLFVEAGAYDGETWSNTLHLERFHNWTGLLIEPSLENYKILRGKNRNAISVNSCLCPGKLSVNSSYIEAGPFGITTNTSSAFSLSSSSSSSS